MRKKPDRKAKAIARLVQNVADAGGPMKLAETVDDHAYRRGVRDGKRAQRSSDLPVLFAAAGIGALLGQIPHLLLFAARKSEEKKEKERREAERLESIRRELEISLSHRAEKQASVRHDPE